jgi:hypothetical protein
MIISVAGGKQYRMVQVQAGSADEGDEGDKG